MPGVGKDAGESLVVEIVRGAEVRRKHTMASRSNRVTTLTSFLHITSAESLDRNVHMDVADL